MWRRRKWMVVAVVAAVVILVGGIIGGVAYAQTDTPTPDSRENTFLARVAEILGIDQQRLEDAFTQAKKEMVDEALSNRLDQLVEQGKITQQEADQYKQWWESRPDIPAGLDVGVFGKFHRKGFNGFRFFPGKIGSTPSATE